MAHKGISTYQEVGADILRNAVQTELPPGEDAIPRFEETALGNFCLGLVVGAAAFILGCMIGGVL